MAASGHSAVRALNLLRCGTRSWCNRVIVATYSAREAQQYQEFRLLGQSASRWSGQHSVCRHFGSLSSSRVNRSGGNGGERGLLHPQSQTALLQGTF